MIKKLFSAAMVLVFLILVSSCSIKNDEPATDAPYSNNTDFLIYENTDEIDSLYNEKESSASQTESQIIFASKIEPDYTNFIVPVEPTGEVPEGYIGIYSPEDLDNVRYNTNANYILMRDLDLSEFGTFNAIENLEGVFDGNGHRISGIKSIGLGLLKQNVGGNIFSVGLFVNANEVKNLGIDNINIEISNLDNINLANLNLSNISDNIQMNVAAIAATANTITNCYVTGRISLTDINYPISTLNFGSVAGRALKTATCYGSCVLSVDSVDYDSLAIGGVVGNAGEVSKSCCDSEIVADCAVKEFDRFFYNFNNGSVVNAGGVVGYNSGRVSECWNSAPIFIEKSEKIKSVSCGGISGYSDNIIEKSYNTGSVQADTIAADATYCGVGGIAGSGTNKDYGGYHYITESYNTGYIVAQGVTYAYAGGILGGCFGDEAVFDCFNSGDVVAESKGGDSFAGGICGNNESRVYQCYNIGNVSSNGINSLKGAICGGFNSEHATVENCYYTNENLNAVGTKAMFSSVKHVNENELSRASDLKGFDFGSEAEPGIWGFNENIEYKYPVLVDVYYE